MQNHQRHKEPRHIPVHVHDATGSTQPIAAPPTPEGLSVTDPLVARDAELGNGTDYSQSPSPVTVETEQPSTESSDVAALRQRVADLEDRWRRAAADLDNYRKRFDRELERQRQLERETIFRAWLTAVDDMERALCAQGASSNPWYEGMEAIHQRMVGVLAQFGVRPFVPQGELFDPAQHEAVATANLSDEPEGKIVEVVESGYLLDGRVLRPAKVIAVKKQFQAES